MADNSYKINKSLNLNPQASVPTNPVDGDVYYDSTFGSYAYYNKGAWSYLNSITAIGGAASMTSSLFTPAIVRHAVVHLTGTAGNLYGMSASFAGKRLTVWNDTNGLLTIRNNSTAEATTNNRIKTPGNVDMNLVVGEVAVFMYDSTANCWLLVSVGSGAGAYLPSTTTTPGIVQLNAAPVNAATPVIPVVDVSGFAVATGITRGSLGAGNLVIGAGATDTGVAIGKSGAPINIAGNLTATQLLYPEGGIDRAAAAALVLGATNASSITIGRTGITTNIPGVLSSGAITSSGDVSVPAASDFKYVTATPRSKMYWAGYNWRDSLGSPVTLNGDPLAGPSTTYIKYPIGSASSAFSFFLPIDVPGGAVITSIEVYMKVTAGLVELSHSDALYPEFKTRVHVVSSSMSSTQTTLTFTSQGVTAGLWKGSSSVSVTVPATSTAILQIGGKTSGGGSGQEVQIRMVRVNYSHTTMEPNV